MEVLVNSDILLRLANAGDPQHSLAVGATDKLRLDGEKLCIVPQNIYELWSVGTRPAIHNGLGLPISEIQAEVSRFKKMFVFREEIPAIYAEWEKLVAYHSVISKNVHDTRLVAAMVVHGITHLLTFNQQDFQRFTGITVLTPADVMATP